MILKNAFIWGKGNYTLLGDFSLELFYKVKGL